ncbi:MAG: hypothetical protein PHG08_00625 [Bacilli bacterium]|nr:hypothetical protein [Bacilli bacterium]
MKKCSKCGQLKELVEFGKCKKNKDGFAYFCKECKKNIDKEYKTTHREELRIKQSEYYNNHKEEYNKYDKERRLKFPKRSSDYYEKRRKIDSLFKLRGNIRTLIGLSIRKNGFSKDTKTATILGCTFEEFKLHIENQFTEGMNWGNYGEWELDHIYPVSLAESEEHLILLNSYMNFQPLWAEDNRRKGNKII